MSRARHARAMGGAVKPVWNSGEGQNAAKEAMERKRGGKVMGEGEMSKHRGDRVKRARGGAVPGRARGGAIGADMKPLTTAAKVKAVTPGELPEKGVPSN